MAGGVLGVALAQWTIDIFISLAGNQLPRAATISIDGRVLTFTAAISILVGIVCGLWPLVVMRINEISTIVRDSDTRTTSGSAGSFSNGLVIGEISIAFALLIGAGLLVKDLVLLKSRDAGIRTDHIVAFDVAPSGEKYKAPEEVRAFYRELYSRLA